MNIRFKHHWSILRRGVSKNFLLTLLVTTTLLIVFYYFQTTGKQTQLSTLRAKDSDLNANLIKIKADLETLQNQDQFKRNEALQAEIKNIQTNYKEAVSEYESLLKLKAEVTKTDKDIQGLDNLFALALTQLSEKNYSSASATLTQLKSGISKKESTIASSFAIPANVPSINTAPGAGSARSQSVSTSFGTFLVTVVAADLNSTKVVVDTASDGDCGNNCPVTSLAAYAGRSGAFAGVNGPYFCPASYPSCAGKTNSFDTLLMNKNKVYFNSANNVYSTVPAVIFSGNSARYVGQSLEWGRDTGVDAVIANQPLLVSGGNNVFGGDSEAKRSSKGARSFIGTTGSTVYIGVVFNASVAEVAEALKVMGVHDALNLDDGGSTALWSNGAYLAGPGRDTPFGILFVRK